MLCQTSDAAMHLLLFEVFDDVTADAA